MAFMIPQALCLKNICTTACLIIIVKHNAVLQMGVLYSRQLNKEYSISRSINRFLFGLTRLTVDTLIDE